MTLPLPKTVQDGSPVAQVTGIKARQGESDMNAWRTLVP
ncbi:hypothetical protein SAMN05442782_1413 [Streptomyces sp. OK228]|nr:hypothetical protein SAMN05442782_1413 [Streptomyces sp. OK228]